MDLDTWIMILSNYPMFGYMDSWISQFSMYPDTWIHGYLYITKKAVKVIEVSDVIMSAEIIEATEIFRTTKILKMYKILARITLF